MHFVLLTAAVPPRQSFLNSEHFFFQRKNYNPFSRFCTDICMQTHHIYFGYFPDHRFKERSSFFDQFPPHLLDELSSALPLPVLPQARGKTCRPPL